MIIRIMKIKENEKRDKYLGLASELKMLWNMRVTLMLIVIGTLGMTPKAWSGGWENRKSKDESKPFKLLHC